MSDERSPEELWRAAFDACERWLDGLQSYVNDGRAELPEPWQPPQLPFPMPRQLTTRAKAMAEAVESLQISLNTLLATADTRTVLATQELHRSFGSSPAYWDARA